MALGRVRRGGKDGKSCFQPEPRIAQEASSGPSSQGALDLASASVVVAAGLGEDRRKGGLVFHGGCSYCVVDSSIIATAPEYANLSVSLAQLVSCSEVHESINVDGFIEFFRLFRFRCKLCEFFQAPSDFLKASCEYPASVCCLLLFLHKSN